MKDWSDRILIFVIVIMTLIFFSLPCFLKAQDFIGDEDFNSKTSKGIVVVEFWAEWNSNNEVDFLNSLKDCKAYKLCIVKNNKLKTRFNIMTIPTVIVLNNGTEEERFLPNIMMQLQADKKKVQKSIDKIILSKFQ
jgi:thioredoxin-like negative regulator of GroEL